MTTSILTSGLSCLISRKGGLERSYCRFDSWGRPRAPKPRSQFALSGSLSRLWYCRRCFPISWGPSQCQPRTPGCVDGSVDVPRLVLVRLCKMHDAGLVCVQLRAAETRGPRLGVVGGKPGYGENEYMHGRVDALHQSVSEHGQALCEKCSRSSLAAPLVKQH